MIQRLKGGYADDAPAKKASLARRFRRRVRPFFVRPLLALASVTVPALYVAYMWIVWHTSRVEDCGFGALSDVRDTYDGFVGMLWHEEVFSVAWAYRAMVPHTLASRGDAGDIISRILRRCGFVVFRGGSSRRASRRREEVLGEMIHHMQTTDRVVYGITVDGSKGPLHEIKRGALVIARECGKPIVLVRTWARWNIRLPTWDRMAIPLPFNVVRQYARGPFHLPSNADETPALEAFRQRMETQLNEMAEESRQFPKRAIS